jgi:hypothetical protein
MKIGVIPKPRVFSSGARDLSPRCIVSEILLRLMSGWLQD